MKQAIYFLARKIVPKEKLQAAVRVYQRLEHWIKYGDARFPRAINLEISEQCNRRCNYCPQSVAPAPKAFMDWGVFNQCMERMAEINWSGPVGYTHFGEPLLDKRLLDMVKLTKRWLPKSMPKIYTNGDVLTVALAAQLIEAGVVNFVVTRHDNDFERWNKKVVPIAERFPDHFTLGDLHGKEISNRAGLVTDPGVKIAKLTSCDVPEGGMHIDRHGNVMLCCCDYNHETAYGNVFDMGLLEIWNGADYRAERESVLAGKPRLNICKGCFQDPGFQP